MTRIELPFPPPLSACFKDVTFKSKKTGRPFTTRAPTGRYLDWQKAAGKMILLQRPVPMLDMEVSVLIRLVAPDRRARDGDNHAGKAVMDLLVKNNLITDDSNRYVRVGAYAWAKSGPACVVYIRPFEEEA